MKFSNIDDARSATDTALKTIIREESLYRSFLERVANSYEQEINNLLLMHIQSDIGYQGFAMPLKWWIEKGIGLFSNASPITLIDDDKLVDVYDISNTILCNYANMPTLEDDKRQNLNIDSFDISTGNNFVDQSIRFILKTRFCEDVGEFPHECYYQNRDVLEKVGLENLRTLFQHIIDVSHTYISQYSNVFERTVEYLYSYKDEPYTSIIPIEDISLVTEETKFKYNVFPDGNLDILKCTSQLTEVTVPDSIDGHTVTRLSKGCFDTCYNMKHLYLPSTIKSILKGAIPNGITLHTVPGSIAEKYADKRLYSQTNTLSNEFVDKKAPQIEQSTADRAKEQKPMSRAEKIKALMNKAEEGIKQLTSSDKFKEYLKTMSKFYKYSVNNQILIGSQLPSASLVASYNSWSKNFNRTVKKGEKGIQIIAPIKKKIQCTIFDKDGNKVLDENGNPKTEARDVISYTTAYVFDVSQTEGQDLPTLASHLSGDVNEFNALFTAISTSSPFKIEFSDIDGSANGYCAPKEQRIVIKKGLSQAHTLKTAIHETAHALYHADPNIKLDRSAIETQAEAVAYVVCEHYGIDSSGYSFPYLASWGDFSVEKIRENLTAIQQQAGDLIEEIDKQYSLLQKNKEILSDIPVESVKTDVKRASDLDSMKDRIKEAERISQMRNRTLREQGIYEEDRRRNFKESGKEAI